MAKFVVEWVFGINRDERLAVRDSHRAWAREQAERGVLLAGGPWANDTGAQVLFEIGDRDELLRLLETDPYASADVIVETRIREWNPVIGSWLS